MHDVTTDPLTGERIYRSTGRAERPNDYDRANAAECPFCPGNEHETPPEVDAVRDGTGWSARAFANKFPAVLPPVGVHEVIVDARDHDGELTPDGFKLYQRRFAAHAARENVDAVVLFKNSGERAGATLRHPHAQLVALASAPQRLDMRWSAAATLHSVERRCHWCDLVGSARRDGLLVYENDNAVALVPAYARFSWEVLIVPRQHAPSFTAASATTLASVHDAICAGTGALRGAVDSLAYNLLLYSERSVDMRPASSHWHVDLLARSAYLAGFELATGGYIATVSPQEGAARLRELLHTRA